MLSAIVVTSLVDNTDADGRVTLREAIQAANTDTSVDGSEEGSGADMITFDPSLSGGLISLNMGQMLISGELSIEGPGAEGLQISGNATADRIFLIDDGTANLINVAISGVSIRDAGDGATNISGGVINNAENLTLKNVEFLQNDVGPVGHSGALSHAVGNLIVSGCTFFGNKAGAAGGGAISIYSGTATIVNSTISGNSSHGVGGGIRVAGGALLVRNSTITGNRSDADDSGGDVGGGIYSEDNLLTLHNTIIAGNLRGTGTTPDDLAGATVTSSSSNLIGNSSTSGGLTDGNNGNIVGVNGSGTRAISTILNTTLTNNGGSTETHELVAGSVAIDSGSNAEALDPTNSNASLLNDQRGNPLPRIFNSTVDIGAYELFAPTGAIVVSTNTDEIDGDTGSGKLSLREAIALSNANPGPDAISFASTTNGTFTLSLGQMAITDSLTITGNGASITILDAQQLSRIFDLKSVDLELIGLTLTNGKTTADDEFGGAIRSSTAVGKLTIRDSTFAANSTTGVNSWGGAIHTEGELAISGSTFVGNFTTGNGAYGGAVSTGDKAVSISQSTFSANSTSGAGANGGAIHVYLGSTIVSQSTLTLNSVSGSNSAGGGISSFAAPLTINNSIVAENTDASGVATDIRKSLNKTLVVTNSLIGRSNGTELTATSGTSAGANGNFIGGGTDGTRIDPLLGPLADNGGPTQTHALLANSLAYNSGNNSLAVDVTSNNALTTDQRGAGFTRILFGIVDIGAVETAAADLSIEGTSGNDAFVLTYSSTTVSGSVAVTRSTDGGAAVAIGTFPMAQPLSINGLGGADSIVVRGSSGNDTFTVTNSGLNINGAGLTLASVETRRLAGLAGADRYRFDTDAALGTYIVEESPGNSDTIDFALATTTNILFSLASTGNQVVNANLNLVLTNGSAFGHLIGGSGNDTLTGNSLANTLTGNGGHDTLIGSGGNDLLQGGLGDDLYRFGTATSAEVDTIVEATNSGTDTLDFSAVGTFVQVSLLIGVEQPVHANRRLTLNGASFFENINGGSGSDTFTGNALNNLLVGNGGNDRLNGGRGDDTLRGGMGNDTYQFSLAPSTESDFVVEAFDSGIDTLDFSSLATSITANLVSGGGQAVHTNRTMTLNGASSMENVFGGTANDFLLGNSLDNDLRGNAGDDRLTGGAGSDRLQGGRDNDTYVFGMASAAESDQVVEINETGIDTIDFQSITTAVTVDLQVNLQNAHTNRELILNGAFAETVIGGSGNDRLSGNSLNNTLIGNLGNDVLIGAGGSDDLRGGSGDDLYVFGLATPGEADRLFEDSDGGQDTLDFGPMTANVTISLATRDDQPVHTNRTLQLNSAVNFENATGGAGHDNVTGNSADNRLHGGGSGNDVLNGLAGNDELSGGLGNDTYVFGVATAAETDTLNEATGGGTDSLRFDTLTTSVVLNLGTSQFLTVHTNRTLKLNSASTFENAYGGSGNDVLTGNSSANVLFGMSGNDTLTGRDGDDSLTGGLGDDTYVFGIATAAESDTLNEATGGGTDSLRFDTLTTNVVLNLGTIDVQRVHTNRTLKLNASSTFEHSYGGSGNDTLSGNASANLLLGSSGNDTLTGRAGNDLLIGGVGDDTYVFGVATAAEADTLSEATGGGTDSLRFDTLTTSVVLNLGTIDVQRVHTNRTLKLNASSTFENAYGGSGNDTLTGNSALNELFGNDGDDALNGLDGNNGLTGGPGNDRYVFTSAIGQQLDVVNEASNGGSDTLDFSAIRSNVVVSLSTDVPQPVHSERLLALKSPVNFEHVIGGSGNDRLTGNSKNNSLSGSSGDDTLLGSSGDDLLSGDSGDDSLDGGMGSDTLHGHSGDDTYLFTPTSVVETDRVDQSTGSGQLDTLDFSGISIPVTLSILSTAPQQVHTNRTLVLISPLKLTEVVGGSGNDNLTGHAGNNRIYGNGGNDTLNGGSGDDELYGGNGDDTLVGAGGGDSLYGETGNDTYSFGPATGNFEADSVTEASNGGTDTLDFSSITRDVDLSLDTTAVQTVHTNRTLKLNSRSTFENAFGGSGNDRLFGNAADNKLLGSSGNDALNGAGGNDRLEGELGDDQYLFGPATQDEIDLVFEPFIRSDEINALNFAALNSDVTVDLSGLKQQKVHTHRELIISEGFNSIIGGGGNDTLIGTSEVDCFLFGNGGNDSLSGSGGSDTIDGGPGNDLLFGGKGNDQLRGQSGDDRYILSEGSDVIVEDPTGGVDTLITQTIQNITLDLTSQAEQVWALGRKVKLQGAEFIENVIGSEGNDTLIGNSNDNILLGGEGADVLQGGLGYDILIGGKGSDDLKGGSENDILVGAETSFGSDITKLNEVRDLWTRDFFASPAQRVADVRKTGIIFTGERTLVFDTLAHEHGFDWLIFQISDLSIREIIEGI